MDQVAIIRNHKDSHISFDLDVQGVDLSEGMEVRFSFVVDSVRYSFECKKGEDNKFHCIVPPLKHIMRTTYPACIEVIVDGYYFKPMQGVVNVIADPLVHVNPPAPEVKVAAVEKTEMPKPTPPQLKQGEKPIEQLAQEAIQRAKKAASTLATPVETVEEIQQPEDKQDGGVIKKEIVPTPSPKKVSITRLSEEEKQRMIEEAKKHVRVKLAENKPEIKIEDISKSTLPETKEPVKEPVKVDADQIRNLLEGVAKAKEPATPQKKPARFKKGGVVKG